MNLLVASTFARAHAVQRALGLPRDSWCVCGAGGNLTGREFDRVVVLDSSSDPTWLEWFDAVIRTGVSPGGELVVVNGGPDG